MNVTTLPPSTNDRAGPAASVRHFASLKHAGGTMLLAPPVARMARRYGVERACWKPGSENWTDEQINIYDRWVRTNWKTREPEPDFNPRAGP